jgi:preprotein translocase subunit Sss1
MTIDDILNFLRKYSIILTVIGSILLILNQTGFNTDIIAFYNALDVEAKILFVGLVNFLITVIAMVVVLNRTGRFK